MALNGKIRNLTPAQFLVGPADQALKYRRVESLRTVLGKQEVKMDNFCHVFKDNTPEFITGRYGN